MKRASSSLAALLAVVVVPSCATYEAVTTAPPEFWATAEEILAALLQDILGLLEMLL